MGLGVRVFKWIETKYCEQCTKQHRTSVQTQAWFIVHPVPISVYYLVALSLIVVHFVFQLAEILQWPSMQNNPLLLFAIINIFNCITDWPARSIVMCIIAVFVPDCALLVYCAFCIRFCFVFGHHSFLFFNNLIRKLLSF